MFCCSLRMMMSHRPAVEDRPEEPAQVGLVLGASQRVEEAHQEEEGDGGRSEDEAALPGHPDAEDREHEVDETG